MRRVSKNVYGEFFVRGCNPSYLVTSEGVVMFDTPQQPIDAVRWRERMEAEGPIRYLINTEPHPDHIRGNAYFPGVEVIGQTGMVARYEQAIAMMSSETTLENLKTGDPDSVWLFNHPDFPPNPPTRTFEEEMTLHAGDHTLRVIHTPGHTPPQTAVLIPEEGVIVIGDTIFHRVQTWLHEADPWQLIDTLKRLEGYDYETIIPGHGEPCGKAYLREQANVVTSWVEAIEDMVKRGLSEEEALKQPPSVDPHGPQQMQHAMVERIKAMSVSNVYRRVKERTGAK